MKLTYIVLSSQLLAGALALAMPMPNALASSDIKARIPAEDATSSQDQDVYNGSSCLKLKRSAEAAASAAAGAYKRYAEALALRSLVARTPGTDKDDQDVYNGSSCLKLKREAEVLALKAREASAAYENELAKRGFVAIAA